MSNMDRIVSRSLLNCHCIGLHSIMLLESPGQTIRLYIAEKGNHLYKNSPRFFREGMSIGFHPHHCDLTLHCVAGRFWNWKLFGYHSSSDNDVRKELRLRQYIYRSQITDGKQGFELVEERSLMTKGDYELVEAGRSIFLPATELHTVVCDPFEFSAWLVYEGQEDPNYSPVCYSTSLLEKVSTEGLYQQPTSDQVRTLIRKAGLIS